MRIVIAGLSNNNILRQKIVGIECVTIADNTLQQIDVTSYDSIMISANNQHQYSLARYALTNKKHVLIDGPLTNIDFQQLEQLLHLANSNKSTLYISYAHRFNSEVIKVKELLSSSSLGAIYHCRLFYGSDTNNSINMAEILDLLYYWFGDQLQQSNFAIISKRTFANKHPDHIIFADFHSRVSIEVEVSLLQGQYGFTADIAAATGSVQIASSEVTESTLASCALEYAYFEQLCAQPELQHELNAQNWIHSEAKRLTREELLIA